MLRAKAWFAEVGSPDLQTLLDNQAEFIRKFMTQLFADLDAGKLPGAKSVHFHRLGNEVRFRIIGPDGVIVALAPEIDKRLAAAQKAGVIVSSRHEPEGEWEKPDANYGTNVPDVMSAFTPFLESVSRAALAFLSTGASSAPNGVLWNWLHLVHNPMTGVERHLVEVSPGQAVHRL